MHGSPTTPPKSREVRLGIVMYGGVSLAIYINGVAHELFRAVRGRGIYKLLKAITDSDIVVDVMSGTSAGGINGILLGYALCNEKEFGDAAALWREHGDLAALLRSPDTAVEACTSVLESEPGYQQKVERGLAAMRSIRETGDEPSPVKELDVFVTGTDVDGVVRTVFDDAGQPIDVKDHRVVFQLKHRTGRRHPFSPSDPLGYPGAGEHIVPALAKLARITSCFPVAFEPVRVVKDTRGKGVDALLSQWGALTRRDAMDKPATYFLDGGVLDNKPFTYTVGAIFSRVADVQVDRTLFYVEPDPETFARGSQTTPASVDVPQDTPNVLKAALAALVTIPGYESISDDLKLIGSRNNKIEQYNRVVAVLQKAGLPPWEQLGDETRRLHTRARLVGLTERVVEGVLNRNGVRHLMSPDEKNRAHRLITTFERLVSGLAQADPATASAPSRNAEAVLADFDVSFRQRRLHRIVYLIHQLRGPSEQTSPSDDTRRRSRLDPIRAAQYGEVLRAANRLLQLYDIVRSAMEGLVDDAPFEWDDADRTWAAVDTALAELLDDRSPAAAAVPARFERGEAWLGAEQLTRFHSELRDVQEQIVASVRGGRASGGAAERPRSLLSRLDRIEAEIVALVTDLPAGGRASDDEVREAHATFRSLDALVYPLELMSGVAEKDVIKTVRISPVDAQKGFSHRAAADKIAGDALYHFGGFLKASWRSNDILWGRLDGACKLAERIVTAGRLEQVAENKALAGPILQRLGEDLDPAQLFRNSGATVQQSLGMWLRRLFDPHSPSVRSEARAELADKLDLLIEAAQLEILHESLEDVIGDAFKEQARWNAFKIDAKGEEPRYDERRWRFKSWEAPSDPLVATVGAVVTARRVVEKIATAPGTAARPSQTGVGKFFTDNYRVGSEGLRADLPPLVLLEIGLRAAIVARKCLLHAFDGGGAAVGRGTVARLTGVLLWAFQAVAALMRRAPARAQAASWAIAAASVTLLGVGLWQGLMKGLTGWTVFGIVPVLALIGVGIVARLKHTQEAARS